MILPEEQIFSYIMWNYHVPIHPAHSGISLKIKTFTRKINAITKKQEHALVKLTETSLLRKDMFQHHVLKNIAYYQEWKVRKHMLFKENAMHHVQRGVCCHGSI